MSTESFQQCLGPKWDVSLLFLEALSFISFFHCVDEFHSYNLIFLSTLILNYILYTK